VEQFHTADPSAHISNRVATGLESLPKKSLDRIANQLSLPYLVANARREALCSEGLGTRLVEDSALRRPI